MKKIFTSHLVLTVFIVVWVIAFCLGAFPLLHFVNLAIYSSTAQIQLPVGNEADIQLVTSRSLTMQVATKLNIQKKWNLPAEFTEFETGKMLADRMDVCPATNSSSTALLPDSANKQPVLWPTDPRFNITYISENADEAALIANTLAETFRDVEREKRAEVLIVERAKPARYATKSICSNLGGFFVAAMLWAAVWAAIAAVLVYVAKRQIFIAAPRKHNSLVTSG